METTTSTPTPREDVDWEAIIEAFENERIDADVHTDLVACGLVPA